jgi:hypothetical protein
MKATHNPPTDVQVTPADLLRFAALYLRRHGWTQGDYYTVVFDALTPRCCVSGAIGIATYRTVVDVPFITDRPERSEYYAAMRALVDYLDLEAISDVFRWNDTTGRTLTEVVDALNAAADRWDALHTQGGDN